MNVVGVNSMILVRSKLCSFNFVELSIVLQYYLVFKADYCGQPMLASSLDSAMMVGGCLVIWSWP